MRLILRSNGFPQLAAGTSGPYRRRIAGAAVAETPAARRADRWQSRSRLRQQTFRARFEQQRLEASRLGRRDRRSKRRQPEVAAPLVVLAPIAQVAAFLHEAG